MDVIVFKEIASVNKSYQQLITQKLFTLLNLSHRTLLLASYESDELLNNLFSVLNLMLSNSKGNLYIIHDTQTDLSGFSRVIKNAILIPVSSMSAVAFSYNDIVIIVSDYFSDYTFKKAISLPSRLIIYATHDNLDDKIDQYIDTLYLSFTTYLIRENNSITIYELTLNDLQNLGYKLASISSLSRRAKGIHLLLYDNYITLTRALVFILNELKVAGTTHVISLNYNVVRQYFRHAKMITKYKIQFYPHGSNIKVSKNDIIIIETNILDKNILSQAVFYKKFRVPVLVAVNNLSINSTLKTLFKLYGAKTSQEFLKLLSLFSSIIKIHTDFSSGNVILECFTKLITKEDKRLIKIIKYIDRMNVDFVIEVESIENADFIINILKALDYSDDYTIITDKYILVEPSEKLLEAITGRKAIVTVHAEDYKNVPIIFKTKPLES